MQKLKKLLSSNSVNSSNSSSIRKKKQNKNKTGEKDTLATPTSTQESQEQLIVEE